MGKIKLLEQSVIDRIAAGEVVVNATSAVKELIENSIDAGSSRIVVETSAGGKKLIRVIDDGCGIAPEDLEFAFMRSATSKLAGDPDAIETLGFRGEALASIATVSKITITSRADGNETGVRATFEGGRETSREAVAFNVGTTIEVRDLFYNTPARLRHLKKDSIETASIVDMTAALALASPEVSFSLLCDARREFSTDGDGEFGRACTVVYSRKFVDDCIAVDFNDAPLTLTGFVSSPARIASNARRLLIVNGRYASCDAITRAIDSAYEEICGKRGASFALRLNVPFKYVDVNIHPAKLSVRFANESLISMLCKQAIKRALAESFVVEEKLSLSSPFAAPKNVKQIVFEETAPYFPSAPERKLNETTGEGRAGEESAPPAQGQAAQGGDFKPIFKSSARDKVEISRTHIDKSLFEAFPNMKYVGMAFGLYAMFEYADNIYVIDTHAAHERVLYDQYLADFRQGEVARQPLLVALTKEVGPMQRDAMLEDRDTLDSLGFSVYELGENLLGFDSLPAYFTMSEASDALDDLIEAVAQQTALDSRERSETLIKRACHNAVRGAENISEAQARALVEDLSLTEMPFTCPHGRPTISRIGEARFMKAFERI
jgi:DNA mismatch repair protein MutL